jgi:hypothetical protein
LARSLLSTWSLLGPTFPYRKSLYSMYKTCSVFWKLPLSRYETGGETIFPEAKIIPCSGQKYLEWNKPIAASGGTQVRGKKLYPYCSSNIFKCHKVKWLDTYQ